MNIKPANAGGNVNVYYGPSDPLVLTDVRVETYEGDRPTMIIEEDFYYSTPVINREGLAGKINFSDGRGVRTYTAAWFPRPDYQVGKDYSIYAFMEGALSDTAPLEGPCYQLAYNTRLTKAAGATRTPAKDAIQKVPAAKAPLRGEEAKDMFDTPVQMKGVYRQGYAGVQTPDDAINLGAAEQGDTLPRAPRKASPSVKAVKMNPKQEKVITGSKDGNTDTEPYKAYKKPASSTGARRGRR